MPFLFHTPQPPAQVAPAPSYELPFETIGSLILVEAKINGKPARLILDTCAGVSLLTPEAAKKFELGEGRSMMIGGAGEKAQQAKLVRLTSLECGGRSVAGQPAVILDLPAGGGKKADGILGMPFLSQYVLKIDYDKKRVQFLSPGAPAPKDATSLELTRRFGLPEVDAEVDGLKGRVRLDTGYGGTFTFTSPTVAREKLKEKYPKRIESVTGQGLGGASVGEAIRISSFSLAGQSLNGVVANLSADKSGALADSGTIGLVGGETLARFVVTFDFPAGKLHLQKSTRFTEPFAGPRAGFSGVLGDNGEYTIRTVAPGSPAAEAGIAVGEKLTAIDGKDVPTLGAVGVREALRSAPGSKLVLSLQDAAGKSRDVTIILKELL
ncbi:MAG: aspartyl protease family protein [Armatimonas sp.]